MNIWEQIAKLKNEIQEIKTQQVDRHNATGIVIATFIDQVAELNSKVLQLKIDVADLKTENTKLKQKVYTQNELFALEVYEQVKHMNEKSEEGSVEYKNE